MACQLSQIPTPLKTSGILLNTNKILFWVFSIKINQYITLEYIPANKVNSLEERLNCHFYRFDVKISLV